VEQAAKARLSSVANSIRLLTSFSGEENELGITTLATRLRLAKSTVHRLASTLTSAGFLEQNAQTGKYRLGVALFELGALVRRRMDVANEARPKLRELLEKTGETVQLGIVDHYSVLYVYEMESPRAIRMAAAVGGRAPLHCTAVGKVLLAFQPADYVKEVLERGLTGFTAKTLTRRDAVLEMLDEVRARGHAVDDEESESGLRAIAAPVRNHTGSVIAALGVAAPVQRMSKKVMQACVPSVIETANAVSTRLGYMLSGRGLGSAQSGRGLGSPELRRGNGG
jgi:DNA-binding IclR family transcriptional regulator